MKNLLTIFTLLFLTTVSSAQINKGQWLVGGLAEVSYQQEGTPSTPNQINELDLKLSPDAGYFIIDGLAVGLRINNFRSFYEQTVPYGYNGPYKYDLTQFTGAAFVRYYLFPNTSKGNFLVDGGYAYGFSDQYNYGFGGMYQNYSNWISSKVQTFFISVGPVIFVTPNIALEMLVSYNRMNNIDKSSYQTGMFFGAGFQLHLGKNKNTQVLIKKPMQPIRN
jgi:hypothetical protein